MTPNCPKNFAPPADAVRALVARIGKSQRWIAERIGISERRLRYLIAGTRDVEGKQVAVTLSYPEEFALECLADAAEVMRSD
jgi:plasmid maintenance system antidote protein VapI